MCGRYALALRPSEVRQQLEQAHMDVAEAPPDDDVRTSYNFAPGYHGLVYRADAAGSGGNTENDKVHAADRDQPEAGGERAVPAEGRAASPKYKLQAMKWGTDRKGDSVEDFRVSGLTCHPGLVPFWTKRNPDYGSMIKTINCRDDSLYEDRGMWTSMKKKKRCIVVAQGFYEWLKKNNGKDKLPHFTKRSDGQLMCFAGLWDCVQYEDSEEKLYTYSIITTDSSKQLKFLHDRMPVILDNGSEAIRTWLDPERTAWSGELQSLLKPFEGKLECYQVSKEVGKVGNNSPSFLVPIDSAANKSNIANFFGNQRKAAKATREVEAAGKRERNDDDDEATKRETKVEHDVDEPRDTTDRVEGSEDNAPLPVPARLDSAATASAKGVKRARGEAEDGGGDTTGGAGGQQKRRLLARTGPKKAAAKTPAKTPAKKGTRSATTNGSAAKGASKGEGSRKITAFFGK